jgi:amino acid transporter
MGALGQARPSAEQDGTLRRGILPLWAVYGIALGILAPSSTLALSTGLISETAGDLSWLTWVVTSVIVLSFTLGIGWLTRRFACTGGLYGLAARAGGRAGAFSVMTAHVLALLLAGPACALGSAIYLDAWLVRIGVPAGNPAVVVSILVALVVAANALLCFREVKVSARLLLAIEFATVGVILILFCVVLAKAPGGVIDSRQLHFGGMNVGSVLEAGGFAVFALAGFENVVTLGREARNPRRAIGLAMTGSILALGVLYVFASYVIVLGFKGISFASSPAPLDTLASRNGVGWLGYLIDLGVAVSFFGSSLGIMAGTSRTLYTMGRDRVLPGRLAKVHATQRTPVAAVTALAVLYLVLGVAGAAVTSPDNSYGYLGTLSGYLLVLAYGLTTLVAGVYAARTGSLRAGIALTTLVALAGIILVYWYSFHPFPQGAYGVVAWCFVGCVALAVVTYATLRLGWPAALARIGRTDSAGQADEADEREPLPVPSQAGAVSDSPQASPQQTV